MTGVKPSCFREGRHPRPCGEDLLVSYKLVLLQMLGTGPSMTDRGPDRRNCWVGCFAGIAPSGTPVTGQEPDPVSSQPRS